MIYSTDQKKRKDQNTYTKKAKITTQRFKEIPAVLTAQGFHKGRLDCVEVSVIHCLDGIAINASSRDMFHRRRLALPSDSPLLSTLSSSTSSSTPLNSSTQNSSTKEENKKVEKKSSGEKRVEILIRDAFATFKGEVPYYSARIMSIPEVRVSELKELDERYEEWLGGEEK